MSKALMIFRRDLRLHDNTALNSALKEHNEVSLAFIVDPRQAGPTNTYRGAHALRFLADSLEDLSKETERRDGILSLLEGIAEDIIPSVAAENGISAIYFNKDYTPFSLTRDAALMQNARALNIEVRTYDDALINPPGTIVNATGNPYAVFSHFYRTAQGRGVAKPLTGPFKNLSSTPLPRSASERGGLFKHPHLPEKFSGGRVRGLEALERAGQLNQYAELRDTPAEAGTSHLSAHLKFGTISVREAWSYLHENLGTRHEPLTRQLYWRDFFTHVAAQDPRVYGHAFVERYNRVTWNEPGEAFELWKRGLTGFPIVDAGMRELSATGTMHNRVRMITASFLTKDLHVHWLEGEKYFAQQLIDYDPAVNNGNWQWVAGTGCDAQPWFRIFNPWLQQKRFDPACLYIRKWVPELSAVPAPAIHAWYERAAEFPKAGYPLPIINHAEEAAETKRRFGRL